MDSLITEIDAFCLKHDMTEGQFGLSCLNDKNFMIDLRAGRDIRFSTAGKCRDFMAAYAAEKAA